MPEMHEVDYEIVGEDLQFVVIELDPQEAAVAEAGAMMYMDDSIEMETIFGDGSQQQQQSGLLGLLVGAGKRLITGESLFMTVFANRGPGKKRVAFGAPYPGRVVPIHLSEVGGELIAQKDSFLCAAKGVSIGIAFQKRIGVGLFGGEGFIMQRLQGDGLAFVHAGGMLAERTLAPGELLRVDTGCIVAFQPSVEYDVQFVGGIKTAGYDVALPKGGAAMIELEAPVHFDIALVDGVRISSLVSTGQISSLSRTQAIIRTTADVALRNLRFEIRPPARQRIERRTVVADGQQNVARRQPALQRDSRVSAAGGRSASDIGQKLLRNQLDVCATARIDVASRENCAQPLPRRPRP